MNYLVHLYFSAPRPLAWAGTMMGDFFKGSRFGSLPDDLVVHLKLHRLLDSYTLDSPAFQTSRRRLDPRFRHGRSILVDVFYDHLLACRWHRYSALPLVDFSRAVYQGLSECREHLSPGLLDQLPRMIEGDWLTSYRREEVVERVLLRLEQRLKADLPLAQGFAQLQLHREALEDDFSRFMLEAAGQMANLTARARQTQHP